MAYQKHRWVHKEIIKAENLNHIEDGIYDEETRAMQAEELLRQSSSTESSRAIQAETALGNRITQTESAITILNADAQTPGSVDYKIVQAAKDFGGYKIVMDHTLVANPSDKYVYLEPDDQAIGSDKFSEWVWTDYFSPGTFAWHQSGEVSLDLSGYIKNTDYATSSTPGIVIVDGTTIQIQNGVISAVVAGGVTSFNGRTGAITPESGDYTASDVGLGNVGNFKAVSTEANQGLTSTEQSNARTNIGAGTSNFDGQYSSLSGKPTIPSKTSDLTNDSGFISYKAVSTVANQGLSDTEKSNARSNIGAGSSSFSGSYNDLTNKPALKTVATTGSYNDLTNKPTIPAGTVTSVATGAGLTGGTITGSGTIKADLKSETKSSLTAAAKGSTSGREYSVGLDSAGDLSVNVPWSDTRDYKQGTSRSGASNNTLYFVYS